MGRGGEEREGGEGRRGMVVRGGEAGWGGEEREGGEGRGGEGGRGRFINHVHNVVMHMLEHSHSGTCWL